jgi:type IV pilus assembly protein PilB
MRQDPDVLLVGETRDLETAKTAIEAALTGHLVLSTLHANDASSTIARLDEMGVEPFMVSASLIGIISQRLLRRVCDKCKEAYRPDELELGRFGLMASRETKVTFFKAHHPEQQETICPNCKGSGYEGGWGSTRSCECMRTWPRRFHVVQPQMSSGSWRWNPEW